MIFRCPERECRINCVAPLVANQLKTLTVTHLSYLKTCNLPSDNNQLAILHVCTAVKGIKSHVVYFGIVRKGEVGVGGLNAC